MKNLKAVLLALLILSLNLSCKKDSMPPKPTQTGANTMYAKVNGKPWQKKACWSCISGGGALDAVYEDGTLKFFVTGQNNDQKIVISVGVKELKSIGTYPLSNKDLNFGYITTENFRYFTSNNSLGIIKITKIDLANKIISGTFEFTAEDENNSANTIKVTDGWFDIVYETYI